LHVELFIGTAGWSVDRALAEFPQEGSGLERYAAVFNAVEINSSFYRRHRPATWQRWHDAVPENFRFSVKLPKTITHEHHLRDAENELDLFFGDVEPLARKLGAVLVQLPPTLAFEASSADTFFNAMRERTVLPIFFEPRHKSWAGEAASQFLTQYKIRRVYADPQVDILRPSPAKPHSCYLRLHGSPKIYYSAYSDESIAQYADLLTQSGPASWCIFDNTASGAATSNALRLRGLMKGKAQT
jgi:uncharacterized protein YecE (DUF72 family)